MQVFGRAKKGAIEITPFLCKQLRKLITIIFIPKLLLQSLLQELILPTVLLLSACFQLHKKQIRTVDSGKADQAECT